MICTDMVTKATEWGGSSDEHLHLGNRHLEQLERGQGPDHQGTWGHLSRGNREFQGGSDQPHQRLPQQVTMERVPGVYQGVSGTLVYMRWWVEERPAQVLVLCCLFTCSTQGPRAWTEPGTHTVGCVREWTESYVLGHRRETARARASMLAPCQPRLHPRPNSTPFPCWPDSALGVRLSPGKTSGLSHPPP